MLEQLSHSDVNDDFDRLSPVVIALQGGKETWEKADS